MPLESHVDFVGDSTLPPITTPDYPNLHAYQTQRQQEFAQLQFDAFAAAYGVAAPAWLVRLYSLGVRLGCEPLQVELSRGGLSIQHFSPLAAAISARAPWPRKAVAMAPVLELPG